MPKVSVIVPIYNVEKYLRKCIDSILEQTFTDIEILLIDDGSPDNCGEICDAYMQKDKRIRVFHKENGGLSDARNYGINKAIGEYMLFIDSDDFIEKEMIETLYNLCIKYNSDISVCGVTKVDESGKKEIFEKEQFLEELDRETAIKYMIDLNKGFRIGAWNKLYKRELFENIKYPKDKIYEDVGTTYKLIDKANKVVYFSKPLYNYLKRNDSITGNKTFSNKEFDKKEMTEMMVNTLLPKYKNIKNELILYKCNNYLSIVNKMIDSNAIQHIFIDEVKKEIIRDLKCIFKAKIKISFKLKFVLFAINFNLYKYAYLKK